MKIRHFKKVIPLLFLCLMTIYCKGQSVDDIILPDSLCLSSPITVSGSSSTENVTFDLCPQDLNTTPTLLTAYTFGSLTQPRGIKVVKDNAGNFYAFITNRNTNTLFRLDFGMSLENEPTINALGNPDNLLRNPEAIDFVQDNGSWYGFVHNTNGAALNIIKLEFGTSLINNPNASVLISNIGGSLSKLSVIKGNNEIYLAVSLFLENKLRIVTLGDLSTSQVTRDFTTGVLPGTNQIIDFQLIRKDNLWQGVVASFNNRTLKWLKFEEGLSSDPSVADIPSDFLNTFRPTKIDIADRGDGFKILVTTLSGTCFKTNFIPETSEFTIEEELESTLDNLRSADLIRTDSRWYHIFVSETQNTLISFRYENNCDVNISSSTADDIGSVKYSTGGNKYIELYGSTDTGSFVILDSVYFYKKPIISFNSTGGCLSESTHFTALIIAEAPSSQNVFWDFGDGNISTTRNPIHEYLAEGDYNVSLRVVDGCGSETIETSIIHIYPDNNISPDFTSEDLKCSNSAIRFSDESIVGGDEKIISWNWNFSGLGNSDEENPTFVYNEPGSYPVTLTVTGESGCSYSKTSTIDIIQGPLPSFTVDDGCEGTSMQFTNTSTGEITSYQWDFGNGLTSDIKDPVVQFDAPGQYLVSLTVSNPAGCESGKTSNITVYEEPKVSFSNELACEGSPVSFIDNSVATNSNIVERTWSFGDPDSEDNLSGEEHPEHIFVTPGDYLVQLLVTTNFGCTSSVTNTVSVKNSPTSKFSFNEACLGTPVNFLDASFAPQGENIISWAWDLGGTFSSQRNPSQTFNFSLDYPITLTVTSSSQCTASSTQQLEIVPVPDITFDYNQLCSGTPVLFTDMTESVDRIVSRQWDFGGLAQSTDSITSFAFPRTGDFVITLTETLSSGCSYSSSETITISEPPEAAFQLQQAFGAPPFVVQAGNTSTGAVTYRWLLDDQFIADTGNLTYTINEPGKYDLTLVAIAENGCEDSFTTLLQVTNPEIDLALSNFQWPVADNMISFDIANRGTLDLSSIPLIIQLGNDYTFTQDLVMDLPADNIPKQVELPWQFEGRSVTDICISVPDTIFGVLDKDLSNNALCHSIIPIQTYPPYPNPADGYVILTTLTSMAGSVHVEIFDMTGNMIQTSELQNNQMGSRSWRINTSHFPTGVYVIRTTSGDKIHNYRMVIQR